MAGHTQLDRILIILLVISAISTVGALAYCIANPYMTEFTEFYILDREGVASNYPRVVALGDKAEVILGIVNQEDKTVQYSIEIVNNGEEIEVIEPIVLANGERWQELVTFTPLSKGSDQKLEFRLYIYNKNIPYRTLSLTIDVI